MRDNDVEELQRIWELKEKGAISEREFSHLKSRILGQSGDGDESSATEPEPDQPVTETNVKLRDSNAGSPIGKVVGISCAVILVLVLLLTVGNGRTDNSAGDAMNVDENLTTTDMNATTLDLNATAIGANVTAPKTAYTSEKADVPEEDVGLGNLTPSQANAARSAEQYLSMTGFSRDGLIQQLSSSAGDGYSVADATAAVDSLSVDWNENAAKSARQYVSISAFSCDGLIEQLSSDAGDKYTTEQAAYGARQAGVC